IGIDDLHIVIQLDIASGDRALTLLGQGQGNLVATMHLDCQTLEVQQDLDDIFLDAFNGAVLMQNAIDFRLYHGTTGHGREQNAPQRIAQGMTEATLQRLKSDLRSEEHTSELQSRENLVCRLLLEKKKNQKTTLTRDTHI